jgi:hypothetical protein
MQRLGPRKTTDPDQLVTPTPIQELPKVPVATARPMAVRVATTATSCVHGFIDDFINVFLDSASNLARQPHTAPLAMYQQAVPTLETISNPLSDRKYSPFQNSWLKDRQQNAKLSWDGCSIPDNS